METYLSKQNEDEVLLYPGEKILDRSFFPYPYNPYTTEYDRIIDLNTPDDQDTPTVREEIFFDDLPKYDSKFLQAAFENMIEKNNWKKPNLTILLDNSLSMRWSPTIELIRVMDVIWKVCDTLEIPLEILWYTTNEWKWWRARAKWIENGRTESPWRLNEVCYIIYKNKEKTFEASKTNLLFMFRDWVTKENIDGEAIEWAYTRVLKQNAPGNVLLHFTDGMSTDDSTNNSNSPGFLKKHLETASKFVSERPDIRTYAVGIGYTPVWVYNGATTVWSSDNWKNFTRICDLVRWVEVPDTLPQEWIWGSTKRLMHTTSWNADLVALLWSQSTVYTHENFSLLSQELKSSIYNFFLKYAEEIDEDLRSLLLNFILNGSPEWVKKKMEVILDIDFCKKWVLWNAEWDYRSLEEFYQEDYVDVIKEIDIATFKLFIEWFKIHGPIVFTLLGEMRGIEDPDFKARLVNVVLIKSQYNSNIISNFWKRNWSRYKEVIDYYSKLEDDNTRDDFIIKLVDVLEDLDEKYSFNNTIFCVLYKAGMDTAYSKWLEKFFNPVGTERKMQVVNHGLLNLNSSHVWIYLDLRYKLFSLENKFQVDIPQLYYRTNDEDTRKIIQNFQNQIIFLDLCVSDKNIGNTNKLPIRIFANLICNPQISSFFAPLISWNFLLLESYFQHPNFLKLISNIGDVKYKMAFDYIMLWAKNWVFYELDDNFFGQKDFQDYVSEKEHTKTIMNFLKTPDEISWDLLQALSSLVSKAGFYEDKNLKVSVNNGEVPYEGIHAVHVLIAIIARDLNLKSSRSVKTTNEDLGVPAYKFFISILEHKEVILSSCDESKKRTLELSIDAISDSIQIIKSYHMAFLFAKQQGIIQEESSEKNQECTVTEFLSLTKSEFEEVYKWYMRRHKDSIDPQHKKVSQEMNSMRDIFTKIRAWQ